MSKPPPDFPLLLPATIATSPILKEPGLSPTRVVLRHWKAKEYAVHKEMFNPEGRGSSFFWGVYFSWKDDTSIDHLRALKKAWRCFVERANDHVEHAQPHQTEVAE
jgi:hypothetical protein